ncbi:MAG: thioredoxin family protein, partial [Methylovulum sp.]|nr:thioredoxin family protein [Methylovulum sp.]
FTQRPSKLNARNFQFYLSNNDIPVVVYFWSPSCESCKIMEPAFTLATVRLEPWVRLAKVNAGQERTLAVRYQINGTPTLIIFKGDREISRKAGLMSASEIMGWVSGHI